MKTIKGNLITLALQGEFDVIAHGCNCRSNMGAGLAPQMAEVFGCDQFEMELWGPDIMKLGNIDYQIYDLAEWDFVQNVDKELIVVNAYTQNYYGRNHKDGVKQPADYDAIRLVMKKMNTLFKGKHIGLPMIGAGLAGGDWNRISKIIKEELKDCKVTIVEYDGSQYVKSF